MEFELHNLIAMNIDKSKLM